MMSSEDLSEDAKAVSASLMAELLVFGAHPGTTIGLPICLDPHHIFAPPVTPFRQNCSATFKPLSGPAPHPKEHKTWVCGERRNGELFQRVPGERRGERWVDEDDIEFGRRKAW